MYKVKHLLDENQKITTLETDKEFIEFTKMIMHENEDKFMLVTVLNCKNYINTYCDNLRLL